MPDKELFERFAKHSSFVQVMYTGPVRLMDFVQFAAALREREQRCIPATPATEFGLMRVEDYRSGYSCGYSDAKNGTRMRDKDAAEMFFNIEGGTIPDVFAEPVTQPTPPECHRECGSHYFGASHHPDCERGAWEAEHGV